MSDRSLCEGNTILSEEQYHVLQFALQGQSLFLTGRAGTGKTTVLSEIIKRLSEMHGEEHVFATSSTGISACHIGGTTVHSFAGIGLGDETVSEILGKMFPSARARWKNAIVLIIEEISMLRPDIFDKLEEIARRVRRSGKPFGGIQVITCGDFYQLPPVYKNEEIKYCFEAACWPSVITRAVELKMVFRQRDDAFLDLLDDARHGHLSPKSIALLGTRVNANIVKDPVPASGIRLRPTLLRAHRETANQENMAELAKLGGKGFKSTAIDVADSDAYLNYLKKSCQAPDVLLMRAGAQVLLLKNIDVSMGLCNGAAGIITEFENGAPKVQFGSMVAGTPSMTLRIPKMDFEIKVGEKIVACRTQFPLILGWAVTIHKSQGMTLESADIELSKLFASGQGYTALSRVKTLDGLSIDSVPDDTEIRTDKKVELYYQTLQ